MLNYTLKQFQHFSNLPTRVEIIGQNILLLRSLKASSNFFKLSALDQCIIINDLREQIQYFNIESSSLRDSENLAFRFGA